MKEQFDPDQYLQEHGISSQVMIPADQCLMKKENIVQFSSGFIVALILFACIFGVKRFLRH